MDESEIGIPDVNVGVIEVQTLHFAGHVGGADDSERSSVEREVIGVDAELRARAKVGFISNPEGGMVDGADGRTFKKARVDNVKAFFGWSGKKRSGGSWLDYDEGRFLRRFSLGIGSDLYGERRGGFCGGVRKGFEFDRLAGKIKRKCGANRKLQRALQCMAGEGA